MPSFAPATPATRKARVLLLGAPKAGKTRAALTFPGAYVIDAEGASDVYAESHPHQRLTTKSYADAMEVVRAIIAGRYPDCETLVIDSLTSIYNTLILSQAQGDGSVDKRGWGLVKRKFAQLTDLLFYEMPCHVVAVGWVKDEYAKVGETVEGQRVGKNDTIVTGIKYDGDAKTVYAFDSVWRMEFDKKKGHYAVAEGARGAVGTKFPRGTEVKDFSWATIAPFYANATGVVVSGMTGDDAAERDRAALEDRPTSSFTEHVPTFGELFVRWRGQQDELQDAQAQAGFKAWLRDAVGVTGATMTVPQKRQAAELLAREAEDEGTPGLMPLLTDTGETARAFNTDAMPSAPSFADVIQAKVEKIKEGKA